MFSSIPKTTPWHTIYQIIKFFVWECQNVSVKATYRCLGIYGGPSIFPLHPAHGCHISCVPLFRPSKLLQTWYAVAMVTTPAVLDLLPIVGCTWEPCKCSLQGHHFHFIFITGGLAVVSHHQQLSDIPPI